MNLDVESLRVFMAVLDHGGMTRAAERLHLGQSAVSRKVQRLEDRVGRPLLIRDGHDLRPTRDGRVLLDDARAIVELHDRAAARLQRSDLTGTVKLACNGEVDARQIASLLGTFRHRHPGACVEFTLDHTGSLVDRIEEGALDVAVFQVTDEVRRPDDITLWSEDLIWVTAATEPNLGPSVPIVDFGEHCYYNSFTLPLLDESGIDHHTVFSAASSIDVLAAVKAGIGVAVMARRYLDTDVVEWNPPSPIAPLPIVHQVVRTVPGERPEAVAALIDTITNELTSGRTAA